MKFTDFKELIETKCIGSTIHLPKKFNTWKLLINESVKKIADKVEIKSLIETDIGTNSVYRDITLEEDLENNTDSFLKEPDVILSEDGIINLEAPLIRAVMYDIASDYHDEIALKQKYILDRDTIVDDYIWNEFTNEELKK